MSAQPAADRFEPSSRREWEIAEARVQDLGAMGDLVDRAFGPGRFAKTAERLREGNTPRLDLSACAWTSDRLIGAVTLWPIRIGDVDSLFLGPIAVDPAWRARGVARALSAHACEAAALAGERIVLLVGERRLFEPLGFAPIPPGRVQLPGPVDLARVLWKPLADGGLEGVSGPVRIGPPQRA